MAIVVDTDVIIRGEKGTFAFASWLGNHPHEIFAVAAITIAELWHGIERATGDHRVKRETYLQKLAAKLPYSQSTALIHAKVWAELEAAGAMTGYYDVMIAATGIEHGYPVATFNLKHFQSVPGLTVIHPNIGAFSSQNNGNGSPSSSRLWVRPSRSVKASCWSIPRA